MGEEPTTVDIRILMAMDAAWMQATGAEIKAFHERQAAEKPKSKRGRK